MSKYVGFQLGKVHESHVISEYYCGGCGYPVTDHDSFCPECGGAFRECDADNLEAENAKLRELLAGDETRRRIAGIGEGMVSTYRGTETVDDARLVVENAKLRELAHLVAIAEYTSVDQCEGCVKKRACNAGELDMCWIRRAILEKLRDLGVEVDG